MIILVYFIIIACIVSYIDSKRSVIPDKIIIPAIVILIALKWFEQSLSLYDFIAVAVVLAIFMIPLVLNMAFGGGDLRYGAFCALFIGLDAVGYFIMLSGIIHLVILSIVKQKSYGFAPAMSIAAIMSYFIGKI